MMIDVFVYGTLLPGERNHHVAQPYLKVRQPGRVRGKLYDAGEYPALVLDPNGLEIEGVWFTVTGAGLKAMDELEEYFGPGQNNYYDRVRVEDLGNGRIGWVYVWEDGQEVPGDPRHLLAGVSRMNEEKSHGSMFVEAWLFSCATSCPSWPVCSAPRSPR